MRGKQQTSGALLTWSYSRLPGSFFTMMWHSGRWRSARCLRKTSDTLRIGSSNVMEKSVIGDRNRLVRVRTDSIRMGSFSCEGKSVGTFTPVTRISSLFRAVLSMTRVITFWVIIQRCVKFLQAYEPCLRVLLCAYITQCLIPSI